jgi:hypothetical protein
MKPTKVMNPAGIVRQGRVGLGLSGALSHRVSCVDQ